MTWHELVEQHGKRRLQVFHASDGLRTSFRVDGSFIPDLSDLYDLHDLARVAGLKPYNMHDLGHVSSEGYVRYKSCTAPQNGKL